MMIAVAVVPSFVAFSLTDCHNSVEILIDRNGVILKSIRLVCSQGYLQPIVYGFEQLLCY